MIRVILPILLTIGCSTSKETMTTQLDISRTEPAIKTGAPSKPLYYCKITEDGTEYRLQVDPCPKVRIELNDLVH